MQKQNKLKPLINHNCSMEYWGFFLLALTVAVSIHGAAIQENTNNGRGHFHTHGKKYIDKRCSLDQQSDINEYLDQMDSCFNKLLPNHTLEDEDGLQERCFLHRKESVKCMENLIDKIRACVPAGEEFLPDFFMEGYKEFSKYLCDHIDVLTLEGLLETDMIECLNVFDRQDEHNPHGICFEGWKTLDADYAPAVNEEIYCEELDGLYECYKRKFKEVCPGADKAWEFEAGLIDGFRAPCMKWRKEQKQKGE